jgi:hypothetical protein|tara:strand:- start:10174 stop:10605 length:432 start_codon:yes stop_codon:yes gene_type:complete
MAITIDESVYEKLTDDKTGDSIYQKVGGRISAEYAAQSSQFPYLVFDKTASTTQTLSFGVNPSMIHDCRYTIRVFGQWEDGVEEITEIGDLVVALFHNYNDSSVTYFDNIHFRVMSGTTVERADDVLVAGVQLRAYGIQTSGL